MVCQEPDGSNAEETIESSDSEDEVIVRKTVTCRPAGQIECGCQGEY